MTSEQTEAGNPPLGPAQAHVLQCALNGYSLFFTGTAGSGKSFILQEIAKQLRERHGENLVFCTAPTGTSAANIGGQTIHSFAGIGLGIEDKFALAKKAGRGEAGIRWAACSVLVIDEVSMLDGQLFDSLEYIARTVRRCQLPFGGIQLLLCGDFFQLPPVDLSRGFAFESPAWARCVEMHLTLPGNFRQRDTAFAAVLDRVRIGQSSPFDISWLESLSTDRASRQISDPSSAPRLCHHQHSTVEAAEKASNCAGCASSGGLRPTMLHAANIDVDAVNACELAALPGPMVRFRAVDEGPEAALKGCAAVQELLLKAGAQVMLLKNLDLPSGLTNGARGVVVGFNGEWDMAPMVRFHCRGPDAPPVTLPAEEFTARAGGGGAACRLQIPLRLAWALTIHKAQGATLDLATVDLSGCRQAGMAYVALSRVRSPAGLTILNFAPSCLRAHPKVVAWMHRIHHQPLDAHPPPPRLARRSGEEEPPDEWISVKRRRPDDADDDF